MGHRKISGLRWARATDEGPNWGVKRARGAKAMGHRYERALAAALPSATHGQWWEFEDANGRGYCQTDLLIQKDDLAIILEAKYSWVLEGHTQLEELYFPVVRMALGRMPLGVVVCKNLRYGAQGVHSDLDSAIRDSRWGRSVLHWLGTGPLFHPPVSSPLPDDLQMALW